VILGVGSLLLKVLKVFLALSLADESVEKNEKKI
jgi:hypothetical protein